MIKREVSSDNYIDVEELQQIQDRFCEANHLYCFCVTRPYEVLTKYYGTLDEINKVNEIATAELCYDLSSRVLISKVENVAESDDKIPAFVRIMTVGLRLSEQAIAAWIVVGFLEEYLSEGDILPDGMMLTNEQDFYKSVQLLETLSKQYMKSKDDETYLKEAMKQSIIETEDAIEKYRRSTSLSRIIGMLDSEKSFPEITNDILKEVGEYAGISNASLLRLNKDQKTVERISEWVSAEKYSLGVGEKAEKSELPFFTGKPYTISYGALLPYEFKTFFERYDIKAGAYLPIVVSDENAMYLSFTENSRNRNWSIDEIKFFNEAKRILQTITAKRVTKNSLASSYVALEAVLENVGCGVRVVDVLNRRTLFANNTYQKMFEGISLPIQFEESFFTPIPIRNVHDFNVGSKIFQTQQTDISWVDGTPARLITIYDVTLMREAQHAMEHEATHDFLTGMYNRRCLETDLERQLDLAKQNNTEGALFYIDVDDFKEINDGLGHSFGDQLLKDIGHQLQKISATSENAYCMGGDEFALILTPQYMNLLDDVVMRIRDIFDRPWLLDGNEYFCTASVGVIRFPKDGSTVENLLQRADLALYDAKLHGKNCIEFYTDNSENSSHKRIAIEHALKKAVRDGCKEFEVFYQPITNLYKTGEGVELCCGAEALVRWNSERLGFVRPDQFIGMAEYLRLIIPIGNYVLEKSCERCKFWNDMGHPEYKVNVNLSVIQLLQNDIVDIVRNTIEKTGINPKNLTLEVTESLAINDMRRMKKVLADLRRLGCRIALDDFGTGYSSLNHIRELPIDVIKIDRCFVVDCGKDDFSDTFVKLVTELAKSINVNVCAEGVETELQLDMMKKNDVQMIQGYYFDKPMPATDFESKYVFG
ncbi:MAG: bifunctional diguanylate cyclase/phosphodiesterase [Lachnospiraceae bacterium]|nr:bifunctional diguanylate cyclase/phosphodiesterase [Lachnospiraceae bacterium]